MPQTTNPERLAGRTLRRIPALLAMTGALMAGGATAAVAATPGQQKNAGPRAGKAVTAQPRDLVFDCGPEFVGEDGGLWRFCDYEDLDAGGFPATWATLEYLDEVTGEWIVSTVF